MAKIFGTHNEREVKKLRPRVERINALEPEISKLTDAELRAKTDEFRRRVQERMAQLQEPAEEEMDADRRKQWEKEQHARHRRSAGLDSGRGVRSGARGGTARAEHAPLRRAADRRHGAALRAHRRDEDRRRQDAGGDPAGVSEFAGRPRRARGDGERLPGQARLGVDGKALQLPGTDGGRDRPRPG